jgi:hypothetical protein
MGAAKSFRRHAKRVSVKQNAPPGTKAGMYGGMVSVEAFARNSFHLAVSKSP